LSQEASHHVHVLGGDQPGREKTSRGIWTCCCQGLFHALLPCFTGASLHRHSSSSSSCETRRPKQQLLLFLFLVVLLLTYILTLPTKNSLLPSNYQCLTESQLDPHLHSATLAVFQTLRNSTNRSSICGCLRLDDPVPSTPPRKCANGCQNKKRLWLVFVGDSTMRQFFEAFRYALARRHQAPPPQLFANGHKYSTAIDGFETNKWLKAYTLDLYAPELNLLVSFRQLFTLSSSKTIALLSALDHVFPTHHQNESAVDAEQWHRYSSYPILDEAFFHSRKWRLPDQVNRDFVPCGPSLVTMSSGLWENPLWSPRLEEFRCGFTNMPFNVQNLLFPRRMATALTKACELFPRNKFVWRTSPVPLSQRYPAVVLNSNYQSTPMLNSQAVAMASKFGTLVMDYQALHQRLGKLSLDTTHPVDLVVVHGVLVLLKRVQAPDVQQLLLEHYKALKNEWNGLAEGNPGVTAETDVHRSRKVIFGGAFDVDYVGLSVEEQALEDRGEAAWSVV
jgi:hypothetical protein